MKPRYRGCANFTPDWRDGKTLNHCRSIPGNHLVTHVEHQFLSGAASLVVSSIYADVPGVGCRVPYLEFVPINLVSVMLDDVSSFLGRQVAPRISDTAPACYWQSSSPSEARSLSSRSRSPSGMQPLNWLSSRARVCNLGRLPRAAGMEPLSAQFRPSCTPG